MGLSLLLVRHARGRRWRRVLQRFGAEELGGRLYAIEESRARTVAMVLERLGSEILLLAPGAELCVLALRGCRGSSKDRVIRIAKRGGIVDPVTIWGDTTIALIPEAPCREFLESDMRVLRPLCSDVRYFSASPARRIDRARLLSLVREFAARAPRKLLEAAGLRPIEVIDFWRRSLYGGAALEDSSPNPRS